MIVPMGMCCFDVTRSLTVAGRLWSKDVNRTKTITANKTRSTVAGVISGARSILLDTFGYSATPALATTGSYLVA